MATNNEIKTELVKLDALVKSFTAKAGDLVEFSIFVNGVPISLADRILNWKEDGPFAFLAGEPEPQRLIVPVNSEWEFKIVLVQHKNIDGVLV